MMGKKVLRIFLFCILMFSALSVKVIGAEPDDVVQMGDKTYSTIAAAVNGLQQGVPTTMTLLKDTEESLLIPEGVIVILDLNGKTLSGIDSAAVVDAIGVGAMMVNQGDLTIIDGSRDQSGKMKTEKVGVLISNAPEGRLTIKGGKFSTNKKYGVFNDGGIVHISDSAEIHGTSLLSFAVFNNTGTLFVEGGTITSAHCAIHSEDIAHISGGTITASDIYAVYLKKSESSISGDPIIASYGSYNGYGVYIPSGANNITISGGTISSENSHGIYLQGENCEISDGIIYSKSANGNAVYLEGKNCVISGGSFESSNNAVYFYSLAMGGNISGGTFLSTEKRAIKIGAPLTITGGRFEGHDPNNQSPLSRLNDTRYTISGGYFSGEFYDEFLDQECQLIENTGPDKERYPFMVFNPRYYATLSLNESIIVNFYVVLPEALATTEIQQYRIFYTYDGETAECILSEISPFKKEDGHVYYKIPVADVFSYEMIKPVNIQVYKGSVLQKEVDGYSVRQYCEDMYAKTQEDRFADLYRSVLDYGAAAQLYFNGKTYITDFGTAVYDTSIHDLANKELNPENIIAVRPEDIHEGTLTLSKPIDDISKLSYAMILGSDIAMKFYFTDTGCNTVDDFAEKYAVYDGDRLIMASAEGAHRFSVKTPGMGPTALGRDHTLTIKDKIKDTTMTLTWSAWAYLYANRNRSGAEGNLYRAMAGYIKAADAIWSSTQTE